MSIQAALALLVIGVILGVTLTRMYYLWRWNKHLEEQTNLNQSYMGLTNDHDQTSKW